jgi:hypothetical protein
MAYVKISDPKIIDLSTIHQIVNVVNQHSDNITALTNNFGSNYTGSSGTIIDTINTEYIYDISSQSIIHGKTDLDGSTMSSKWITGPVLGSANAGYYQIPVNFMGNGFVKPPTVTVTMDLAGSAGSAVFTNMFVWTSNVTNTGFKINIRSQDKNTAWFSSGHIYAHWIAIGPKG